LTCTHEFYAVENWPSALARLDHDMHN